MWKTVEILLVLHKITKREERKEKIQTTTYKYIKLHIVVLISIVAGLLFIIIFYEFVCQSQITSGALFEDTLP